MNHSTLEIPNINDAAAPLDLNWARAQFPALSLEVGGQPAAFLDGPGGTQVPQRVIDATTEYLRTSNANTCGAYATSRRTDQTIAGARLAMADFLGCDSDEIVIGPNMTSLTYAISRAIGRELGPGDEIVLTHLDHDANISPWRALEERGVKIQMADIREEDCTLNMEDLARKINSRTKVVAAGYASNAVGTINDAKTIVRLAHEVGALAFIDAVHYAPHGPIDVRELDCDFLACSTYKFFGPHMGVLYGKREHLARLQPYKLRANTNAVPQRWEWGTLNHECIAGITACVEYLVELGRNSRVAAGTNHVGRGTNHVGRGTDHVGRGTNHVGRGTDHVGRGTDHVGTGVHARPVERSSTTAGDHNSAETDGLRLLTRREALLAAHRAIRAHELKLMRLVLRGLAEIPGLRLYGIADPTRLDSRCPTFAVRINGYTPLELATKLGQRGIFTWDGNYYALNLTERLGVEQDGGFLRIGLVHYNTEAEVDHVIAELKNIRS
jgi:cysteine desulfurase family protein (TIGR01976 family)